MAHETPAVSVLMPCYNAGATLEEALESLARQDLDDFEIVAVDDGSVDDTPAILERWAARDGRLRVLSRPHAGIVAALNAGLEICRAPLVARMDADDLSHPSRLSQQAALFAAGPDLGVVSCLVGSFPPSEVREGFRVYLSWVNSLLSHEQITREIFVESPLPHPSVMFRKDLVTAAGGYLDRGWPEDYDLWLRLYLAGARFAKVPQVLLDWRESPERLTRTDSRYSVENFLRLKAHILCQGPLLGRDAVFIWGAGMMGRRLSKHLVNGGAPLVAFFDVDPRKIGRTRRGRPILPPAALPEWWKRYDRPALLAAVGARNARRLIRSQIGELSERCLHDPGLVEGVDWWCTA